MNDRLNTKQPKFRYQLGLFHADSILCALAVGNSASVKHFMVTPFINDIQHFIVQLIHTKLKNVELLKYF